ncbi:MAG TPA: hypothetical protein VI299_13635 [Polyangiales bacterium]
MLPLLGLTACGFSFGTESRTIAEEERFCAALTLERCEREFDDDVPRCRIRRASWASPARGCFEAAQDLVCAINLSCAGFTETFARDLDGGVWRWSDDCTIAGFTLIDGGDFAERYWQDCTTKCGKLGVSDCASDPACTRVDGRRIEYGPCTREVEPFGCVSHSYGPCMRELEPLGCVDHAHLLDGGVFRATARDGGGYVFSGSYPPTGFSWDSQQLHTAAAPLPLCLLDGGV